MRLATLILLCMCALLITACAQTAPNQPVNPSSASSNSATAPAQNPASANIGNDTSAAQAQVAPATYSNADPTHLPIGDNHLSTQAKKGYVWRCGNGIDQSGGGASGTPTWNNNDNSYDETKKPHVHGNVSWPYAFGQATAGELRVISTNDLPNHGTGVYPIQRSDAAFQFDQNPNSISSQSLTYSIPLNPQLAATPSCVGGGPVGIMLTGTVLFDGLDAQGRDAGYHEIQDSCSGHPEKNGEYHYHTYSPCMNNSGLIGYAMDGFGIYGYMENGKEVTSADLDECHGRTSTVEWNGKNVSMYHYYLTRDFPYSIGCFKGTPVKTTPQNSQTQSNQQSQAPQQNIQNGPPQAAFDACNGKSQGDACSFQSPRGQVTGTCQTPQGSLVCVPQR